MSRYLILIGLALSGCGIAAPEVSRFVEPRLFATRTQHVDLTRPEVCQARDESPAVIETVTESRGENGTYHTEKTLKIVESRRVQWFDTPCLTTWTPDFIASVQRALIVRGLMSGPATGAITSETRAAIRAFQREEGINSDVLSIAAAKRMGLVVYDRSEALRR